MAYISANETKAIRKELKAKMPGFKFSVKNKDYMRADIQILSGDADFDFTNGPIELHTPMQSKNKTIQKIIDIVRNAPALADGGRAWYDNSDCQADYEDTAFYYSIFAGDSSCEKPYIKK